jgi:hypothetical protein
MLNQYQILNEKKASEHVSAELLKVTPLKMEGTMNADSNRMKELKKPRSRKYINDLMELQEMLTTLDKKKKEIKTGFPSAQTELPITGNTDEYTGSKIDLEPFVDLLLDKELNIIQEENQVYRSNEVEKTEHMTRIKNTELDALEKSIQDKLDSMAKEYPLIRELLSLVYPESVEEYLISCGVINRPGRPVYNRDDMAVNVEDEKVAEQLKRGYDVFCHYVDTYNFLCLEIYIDAFCVIYKDGIVKTVV